MKYLLIWIILFYPFTLHALAKDRGGAISINGKMLESYIEPADSLKGFQESVQPILEKLRTKAPHLAETIEMNIFSLTWYVLPVPVEKLSSHIQGIPIENANFDQSAVQWNDEVFSDEKLLAGKSVEEAGKFILHEALLREKFKIGVEDIALAHSQTRRAVDAIVADELSAEELGWLLERLGFARAAFADISRYILIEQRPKERGSRSREGIILSRKGTMFTFKFCHEEALETVHARQAMYNQSVFPGIQAYLAKAFRHESCKFIENKMYNMTSEFANFAQAQLLSSEIFYSVGEWGSGLFGAGSALSALSTLNRYPYHRSVRGVVVRLVVSLSFFGSAYFFGSLNDDLTDRHVVLKFTERLLKNSSVVSVEEDLRDLKEDFVSGFHELKEAGYARSHSFKVTP